MEDLNKIVIDAKESFRTVTTIPQLEQTKGKFLGKSGVLAELRKGLGKVSAEERPALAQSSMNSRMNLKSYWNKENPRFLLMSSIEK